jgi:hypothetical protein
VVSGQPLRGVSGSRDQAVVVDAATGEILIAQTWRRAVVILQTASPPFAFAGR